MSNYRPAYRIINIGKSIQDESILVNLVHLVGIGPEKDETGRVYYRFRMRDKAQTVYFVFKDLLSDDGKKLIEEGR